MLENILNKIKIDDILKSPELQEFFLKAITAAAKGFGEGLASGIAKKV